MSVASNKSTVSRMTFLSLAISLSLIMAVFVAPSLYGKEKKKVQPVEENSSYRDNRQAWSKLDTSKFVWPNPPAIHRIRYINYWSGEKFTEAKTEKKSSWMERVSGVTTGETRENKPRWQLAVPNGIAVDSKNRVYVADSKVRAIFVVNAETGDYEMIKNGTEGRFQWLTGLVIDDSDRLFAADSGLHHVVVFDAHRKFEGAISEGLYDPGNLAIDNENRLLYVTDAEQDLVLVYDADPPFKLVRRIGRQGTKHTSTVPGEFAKPSGVAVDQDGMVYVADTWNDRIHVFDTEGNFIRTFGKAGDGPGYFARPKGVAVDCDGHVWVADAVQDRVQAFTPEGRLLIYMGGHGLLPGQFQSLANIAIDKNNRIFTTEQLAGRLQIFRYTTDAEARAELDRRNVEAKKKSEERRASTSAESKSAEDKKN